MTTDFYSKGGIQRYSRYQYRALVELYGRGNIFIFALSPKQEGNIFEEEIDVDFVGDGLRFSSKLKYAYEVLRLVKREKIDLIISAHVQLSIIAFVAKKLFSVTYTTNVYGLEIWSGLKKRDLIGLMNSDKLIGDCEFILNYIDRNFEYNMEKTALLFDPIDMDVFKPGKKSEAIVAKYGIPKDGFVLTTVGRLERNKGHEIVIRALAQLNKKIAYVVVGGGRFDERFRCLAESEGVADRVFFAGRVPEDELVEFYNLADVVVLLSTFGQGEGEGLPLGLIEASACGRPIIAGNEDGSYEAISEEFPNGFAIDPTNVQQVVGRISSYFEDRKLQAQHGKNGRMFARNNFEFSVFKEKLHSITLKMRGRT